MSAPITGKAGKETERKGNASTEAAAAVQTRCLTAAGRPRSRAAANHATPRAAVLLSATTADIANQIDSFQPGIYLPSRFAFSIISVMRSNSSRVSFVDET